MDLRRPGDQRIGNVGARKRLVGAAVGEEAALAGRIDERDEPAGRTVRVGGEMGRDASLDQPRRFGRDVRRADARDEVDGDAEGREPGRLVGRRAARLETDRRPTVGTAGERPLRADDDVGHHVADHQDARRTTAQLTRLVAVTPEEAIRHAPGLGRPDRSAT